MKKDEIIALFEASLASGLIKSETDFRQFLEILKTNHRSAILDTKDFEQSWKGVKGSALEGLVEFALTKKLDKLGLKLINGNRLPKTLNGKSKKIPSKELQSLYEQLVVSYGTSGKHLPDADIIIYRIEPNVEAIAILSVKSSLRERIAQAAYWKQKVSVPFFFVTTDNDDDFLREIVNKSRAIAEQDTSGVYLITENEIQETERVKYFHRLPDDLHKLNQTKP